MKIGELQVVISLATRRFTTALSGIQGRLAVFKSGLNKIGAGVGNVFRNITNIIRTASLVIGVALVGATVAGALFGDAMNRTFAIISGGAELAKEQMVALTAEARRLGRETLYSSTQAAKGMQVLALAGFKTQEIIGAIAPTLNMAIVGNLDLAAAASITIAALKSFQMEAGDAVKVADILAKAATSANVTVASLGEAFTYSAAVANAAGMSMEELGAAIGQMGNAGFQGSMAGTAMRRALSMMLNPTNRAQEIMERLGVTFKDSTGKLRPFVDIIGDLNKAGAGASDMLQMFGLRAGPAMVAMVNMGTEGLKNLQTELENSAGTADKMSQKFRETIVGRSKDLIATLNELAITFTKAFGKSIADSIFGLRNWLNAINEALQQNDKLQRVVTAIKEGLGPLADKFREVGAAILKWVKNIDIAELEAKLKSKLESISNTITKLINKFKEIDWKDLKVQITGVTVALMALGGTSILTGIGNLAIALIALKKVGIVTAGVAAAKVAGVGLGAKVAAGAGGAAVAAGGIGVGGIVLAGAAAVTLGIIGTKVGEKLVKMYYELLDSFKPDLGVAQQRNADIKAHLAEVDKLNYSTEDGMDLWDVQVKAACDKINAKAAEGQKSAATMGVELVKVGDKWVNVFNKNVIIAGKLSSQVDRANNRLDALERRVTKQSLRGGK